MLPDQAKFLLDFLLPQLQSEQAITRKIIAAVPLDGDHYRPNPKAMSAFELARHIGICELWFLDAILRGRFEDVVPPPETAATCSHVAAWYAVETAKRIPLLQSLAPASLATRIDYIGLRNDPAVAYVNIAIRHTVHHRGQLSAYLRGMGAAVPAIYVESADEPDLAEPPAF